ncbi:GNAT family N-acetyltransferase [Sporosarcina sp. HYO08]|uniref:GNAT family N-acetyltransferase n=1 Tax=Sporosarcina sp. HYO08 TaxID=1759557 RepID=UPI0007986284|nr:N-acetyltransferase [Sporosarcina sp. HYO08]KXH80648.1 GCN5 family acetyltransferase [Sporosarcina sp. HYO08]
MNIQQEQPEHYTETEKIVKVAFLNAEHSDGKEHLLVKRLRSADAFIPELSLVAIDKATERLVGHVLLTKIEINDGDRRTPSLALAPVSVLPDFQNQGIGSSLIKTALVKAAGLGYESVVVLGYPAYYPKFGFKQAAAWGVRAPFDVPIEAFMALELVDGALQDAAGVVAYHPAFFE